MLNWNRHQVIEIIRSPISWPMSSESKNYQNQLLERVIAIVRPVPYIWRIRSRLSWCHRHRDPKFLAYPHGLTALQSKMLSLELLDTKLLHHWNPDHIKRYIISSNILQTQWEKALIFLHPKQNICCLRGLFGSGLSFWSANTLW